MQRVRGQQQWRCGRWLGLCCVLSACSAYNPHLLKPAQSQSSLGGTGGQATGGSGGTGGTGGVSGFGGSGGTGGSVSDNDGGSTNEFPSQTRCGDGQVTGSEKCDIGILPGMPGACPTSCDALGPCTPRALNGSGCQAECVLLQVSCMSGDGCCPGTCTHDTDSDCSGSCGDGVVQSDMGETCEDGSSTPCPTEADCNDNDPCTTDTLMGSASNCNAQCEHTEITSVASGDMCCPKGANANTDTDCTPVCGNGVKETGEACDGTMGCDSQCKLTMTPDQVHCLENFAADDCEMCTCLSCTSEYLACRDNSNQNDDSKCNAVLICSRANNCVGGPCYCGNDTTGTCGYGTTGPQGPCVHEIESAAGALPGDVFAVNAAAMSTNNPLGRAYVADQCRVNNCVDVCR